MINLKQHGFKYVIFSIRSESNPMIVTQFKAMWADHFGSAIRNMIGCWDGLMEHSWMCTTEQFDEFFNAQPVLFHAEVVQQECVLLVSECNKQYCALVGLSPSAVAQDAGCMHVVSREEAIHSKGWTYDPRKKQFWMTKPDNPDRVPPPSGHLTPEDKRKARIMVQGAVGLQATLTLLDAGLMDDGAAFVVTPEWARLVSDHLTKHFGTDILI